jgi:signal transduction histidine kinase
MHALVWVKDRSQRAHLAFAALAVGAALFTWANLVMMRAQTPEAFANALWWNNCIIFLLVVAVVAFIRSYFRTARPWLGHLAWILRLLALVVNFVHAPVFDYDSISAMRPINFLGDRVYVADGVTSVWHWFGQISLVMLVYFILDASYSLWRLGSPQERRRALVIGIPAGVFVVAGAGSAALIFGRVVDWPHLEFVPFMGLLIAMGYELSSDVLRAAKLASELQMSETALRESEQRMTMAADAARLGMWIWELQTGDTWLTNKCRELFAFPQGTVVTYDMFLKRLHPDDRDRIEVEIHRAIEIRGAHQIEYRIALPDGSERWIVSHLKVDADASALACRVRGVCIDVSQQRYAELAARELSGRLINAQEEERSRLARDLHDDLSQRLALILVEVELLRRTQRDAREDAVEQLATQLRELSSEVHRLSYQLHPAKLDQLGLESAARSWCRDVTRQSGVLIEFVTASIPADVPPEIALCFYRIIQEALRNVARHSHARTARVEFTTTDNTLDLVVSDTGHGFDVTSTERARGLGLLSMRERAHLLGGTIEVRSRPGDGTSVVVAIPLPAHRSTGRSTPSGSVAMGM